MITEHKEKQNLSFWETIRVLAYFIARTEKGDSKPLSVWDYIWAHRYVILNLLLVVGVASFLTTQAAAMVPMITASVTSYEVGLCLILFGQYALYRVADLVLKFIGSVLESRFLNRLETRFKQRVNQQWDSVDRLTRTQHNPENKDIYWDGFSRLVSTSLQLTFFLARVGAMVVASLFLIPLEMLVAVMLAVGVSYLLNTLGGTFFSAAQATATKVSNKVRYVCDRYFKNVRDVIGLGSTTAVKTELNKASESVEKAENRFGLASAFATFLSGLAEVIQYTILWGSVLYLISIGVVDPMKAALIVAPCQTLLMQLSMCYQLVPWLQYITRHVGKVRTLWLDATDDKNMPDLKKPVMISYDTLYHMVALALMGVSFMFVVLSTQAIIAISIVGWALTGMLWPQSSLSIYGLYHIVRAWFTQKKTIQRMPEVISLPVEELTRVSQGEFSMAAKLPSLEPGHQYLLEGENGSGKSLFFGAQMAGKLPAYMESNASSMYQHEASICMREPFLVPTVEEKSLCQRLLLTFGIPESEEGRLKAYINVCENGLGEHGGNIYTKLDTVYDWQNDDWGSTGEKQQLFILALMYRLKHKIGKKIDYICLDEALSGLDENKLPFYYNLIQDTVSDYGATLVIVHHGYDISKFESHIDKINIEKGDDSNEFTVASPRQLNAA